MIDTDKYEGHTEGEWDWLYNDEVPVHLLVVPQDVIGIGVHPENNVSEADMKLIADAPLLLEEVKRLREDNHVLRMIDWEYEKVWEWLMENADDTCRKLLLLIEEWKEGDEE